MEDNGIYLGRTPEQIRFKNGDIVEVMNGEEIELGFVVGVPPDPEWAERFNNHVGIHMDDTDDSYTILFGSNFAYHFISLLVLNAYVYAEVRSSITLTVSAAHLPDLPESLSTEKDIVCENMKKESPESCTSNKRVIPFKNMHRKRISNSERVHAFRSII